MNSVDIDDLVLNITDEEANELLVQLGLDLEKEIEQKVQREQVEVITLNDESSLSSQKVSLDLTLTDVASSDESIKL